MTAGSYSVSDFTLAVEDAVTQGFDGNETSAGSSKDANERIDPNTAEAKVSNSPK